MSFLNTHRLHWGSHPALSLNLHEHLDLMMKQGPEKLPADPEAAASTEVPTEMPSQIIQPPTGSRELGS